MSTISGDVLFVATKQKFSTEGLNIAPDVLIKGGPLADYTLPISIFDQASANLLTDDKNNSDELLKSHYFQVRNAIRKELAAVKAKNRM